MQIDLKSNVGLQVMPIDELIERVASVCKRCGAEHLDLFGSFATGTATDRSDIDFVVYGDVDSELFAFSMNYIDQMMSVDENCYEVQSLIQSVQNNQDIEEIQLENKQQPFHLKNKTIQIMYVIFLHLIRFISSSIISSVIDVLLAWILLDVLKLWMTSDFWRIALSSLIARILSTIVNYVINKKYVFKGKNNSKQTARRFLILTIVITILSTLFVYAASSLHIMSEKLAKPIGDLLLFLLSYSAQTKWVFKNNESKNHLK